MARQRSRVQRVAIFLAVVLVAFGCRAPSAAALVDIGSGLQGPASLAASVYATTLPKVAAIAFDDAGRLWAATADYNDAGQDAIYLVAEPGATPLEVVSGVHTPLGLLWLDGSLYVSAQSGVTAYGGFDGTRFATSRTILTLPSGVGEVNELALAPDGRIWLGVSAPCDDCEPASSESAAVLSFLPDGSDLVVEASGIRAPVGLAFDAPSGELYVTMNQRDDLGDDTPGDWLGIVRTGQDWGFPECYGQGGAACAGAPTPVAVLDAHAAVAGVAIVDGELGSSVGHAALVAEWAFGKVQLVRLDAGAASAVEPFLAGVTSPVAVVLGPDSAVYVGDWATGSIYRIAPSTTS
jgi:glucose/arabinose dehydrogenase